MRRKDLDYLVIVAMLVSGLYVTFSGLVADVFGFPQFALHPAAGYVTAALATVHLALNWRKVMAYLRKRLGLRKRRERPETPAERSPARGRRDFVISGLAAVGGFILGRLLPRRRVLERPGEDTDLGELYHQWSKPGYLQALGALLDWGTQPERYKTYPDARQITLPDPRGFRGLSMEEAVETRRSVRDYTDGSLPLEQLSYLLHAAQGITEERWDFRAAPSAGALYPIELYAVAHDVAGLEPGIYHYAVQTHGLELLRQRTAAPL
ncbi:MAG TPA: SagB/ThcOx family dehydrogenase [Chloroflexi bacterium]|nr:SagB/ThcOx family dehydrogenase [Chloroflexota bacterium]